MAEEPADAVDAWDDDDADWDDWDDERLFSCTPVHVEVAPEDRPGRWWATPR